jgi:hypothetical protein
MSRNRKTLILGGASLIAVVCLTSAILISRASTRPSLIAKPRSQAVPRTRNLRLQPEAVRVNRRLGNRFTASSRAESILTGTLTFAANKRPLSIIRRQIESGEFVEVVLADRRLTWSNTDGIRATQGTATEAERLLVERLIFDSPDQFVLAQLRGASYHTVTRNLRPTDAGENYSGPLWGVVRISEPQENDEIAPESRWRLYYINEATELIDRVVSEVDGQQIEAGIQWTENNGEQIPSNIKWTRFGEGLMEFEITAFSHQK